MRVRFGARPRRVIAVPDPAGIPHGGGIVERDGAGRAGVPHASAVTAATPASMATTPASATTPAARVTATTPAAACMTTPASATSAGPSSPHGIGSTGDGCGEQQRYEELGYQP